MRELRRKVRIMGTWESSRFSGDLPIAVVRARDKGEWNGFVWSIDIVDSFQEWEDFRTMFLFLWYDVLIFIEKQWNQRRHSFYFVIEEILNILNGCVLSLTLESHFKNQMFVTYISLSSSQEWFRIREERLLLFPLFCLLCSDSTQKDSAQGVTHIYFNCNMLTSYLNKMYRFCLCSFFKGHMA